eukprot:3806194-Rhodomonas_salina.1
MHTGVVSSRRACSASINGSSSSIADDAIDALAVSPGEDEEGRKRKWRKRTQEEQAEPEKQRGQRQRGQGGGGGGRGGKTRGQVGQGAGRDLLVAAAVDLAEASAVALHDLLDHVDEEAVGPLLLLDHEADAGHGVLHHRRPHLVLPVGHQRPCAVGVGEEVVALVDLLEAAVARGLVEHAGALRLRHEPPVQERHPVQLHHAVGRDGAGAGELEGDAEEGAEAGGAVEDEGVLELVAVLPDEAHQAHHPERVVPVQVRHEHLVDRRRPDPAPLRLRPAPPHHITTDSPAAFSANAESVRKG